MILSLGEVYVAIPGFHPILLVRTWFYGRRVLRQLRADELTVDELVEQLRGSGARVKVTES